MFAPRQRDLKGRSLDVDEIRLVSDLRIMHSKVDELYQIVRSMRERHDQASTVTYAERTALAGDITKVDEIYLWFITIKEEMDRRARANG